MTRRRALLPLRLALALGADALYLAGSALAGAAMWLGEL